MNPVAYLELIGVDKGYGTGAHRVSVLRGINLRIERGEFVAVVGFSGCGKTTLINLVAGLVAPDTGEIRLDGVPVTSPGPERGVVFQAYALLPWLTVGENVALAVDSRYRDWPRRRRLELVERQLATVGLTAAAEKRPAQLSGGMRQRVAVARALALDPELLLLDEPLSALDALTRAGLQDEIVRLWEADRKTVVLITNDVDESLLLADRIVPLTPGPGATLGPSIPVALARPRNRKALNHDLEFKRLRAAVTGWLFDAREARRRDSPAKAAPAPALVPVMEHR